LKYTHDCDACIFLGTVNLNNSYNEHTTIDIYVCPVDHTPIHDETIIARYGDDGPDYISSQPEILFSRMYSKKPEDNSQFDMAIQELHMQMFSRWKGWLAKNKSATTYGIAIHKCFEALNERNR